MADPNQQPGLLSDIGSGLSSAASGLGKILPYAIPIGLGAAMGGGVGAGLGGAAAGLASAEGSAGERQQAEKEFQLKQQQLAMEHEKWDLDKKKGMLSLQNDEDIEKYAQTITDPKARAQFRSDPKQYFADGDWTQYTKAIATDPGFAKAQGISPDLAKQLPKIPPEEGKKLIEMLQQATASGKYTRLEGPQKAADGKWYYQGFKLDGSVDKIAAVGEPASASNIVLRTDEAAKKTDDKTDQALNTKAVTALTSEYSKYRSENDKVAQANAKKFSWQAPDPLPHPDLPDSADDYIAKGLDSRVGLLRAKGSSPMSDPNVKLKSAGLPAGKPPKELWGKTGTLNGKKVKIDDKGNVSPL